MISASESRKPKYIEVRAVPRLPEMELRVKAGSVQLPVFCETPACLPKHSVSGKVCPREWSGLMKVLGALESDTIGYLVTSSYFSGGGHLKLCFLDFLLFSEFVRNVWDDVCKVLRTPHRTHSETLGVVHSTLVQCRGS